MKKIILLLVFSALYLCAYTQETSELEITYKGDGKILMEDGSEIEGSLEYNLTNDHVILLYKEGENKPEKIKYKDFKSFNIGDQYFTKIKVITIQVTGSPLNDPNSKILVLKSVSQSPTINGGNPTDGYTYRTVTGYYVIFTESNLTMSIDDIRCSNKKISSLVSKCAELSKKIAAKEEGYVFSLSQPQEDRIDLLKKIAAEYQKCE